MPAFCWSHVRRGFYDRAKVGITSIATEALRRIDGLHEIEAMIRGNSPAERLPLRQTESRPRVVQLGAWFEAQLGRLPARGPTAESICNAPNQWDGLERFHADGRIEMDTNSVERSMRPVGLSRKNSLLAGSDKGRENRAALESLHETCTLNGANPQSYNTDILTWLVNSWLQHHISELML